MIVFIDEDHYDRLDNLPKLYRHTKSIESKIDRDKEFQKILEDLRSFEICLDIETERARYNLKVIPGRPVGKINNDFSLTYAEHRVGNYEDNVQQKNSSEEIVNAVAGLSDQFLKIKSYNFDKRSLYFNQLNSKIQQFKYIIKKKMSEEKVV